ncbi:hypothetical protein [Nocardia sp. NBC_01327]|uniref:hypothetical protein n=1 Tax=Nocardia sp. NBC_01327 TaxID=2903593 RepID=UPI002E133984|nr:hypothetical protein OG326_30750 [Nocardia sp. NBC_01327]
MPIFIRRTRLLFAATTLVTMVSAAALTAGAPTAAAAPSASLRDTAQALIDDALHSGGDGHVVLPYTNPGCRELMKDLMETPGATNDNGPLPKRLVSATEDGDTGSVDVELADGTINHTVWHKTDGVWLVDCSAS